MNCLFTSSTSMEAGMRMESSFRWSSLFSRSLLGFYFTVTDLWPRMSFLISLKLWRRRRRAWRSSSTCSLLGASICAKKTCWLAEWARPLAPWPSCPVRCSSLRSQRRIPQLSSLDGQGERTLILVTLLNTNLPLFWYRLDYFRLKPTKLEELTDVARMLLKVKREEDLKAKSD